MRQEHRSKPLNTVLVSLSRLCGSERLSRLLQWGVFSELLCGSELSHVCTTTAADFSELAWRGSERVEVFLQCRGDISSCLWSNDWSYST